MKSKILRSVAAALLAASAMSAAFALQVDQTRLMNARQYADYHPNYYRVTINYNDQNIGSGQLFGKLKQNDFVKAIDCHVTTAFNAGSSNAVTFGYSTAANEIVASSGANASITAGSTGIYHLTAAAGLGLAATSQADINLYAKYAQTGTAASAGAVTCVIEFVSNNDM